MDKITIINSMLRVLHEPKVNSLDNATTTVTACSDIFDEVKSTVLQEGWWFNKREVTLYPTVNKQFKVPSNIIELEVLRPHKLVKSNNLLFDMDKNTYTIDLTSVKAIATYDRDIESIPAVVAKYILAYCRLNAVDDLDGDINIHQIETLKLQDAIENARAEEVSQQQLYMLDSPAVANVFLGGM